MHLFQKARKPALNPPIFLHTKTYFCIKHTRHYNRPHNRNYNRVDGRDYKCIDNCQYDDIVTCKYGSIVAGIGVCVCQT